MIFHARRARRNSMVTLRLNAVLSCAFHGVKRRRLPLRQHPLLQIHRHHNASPDKDAGRIDSHNHDVAWGPKRFCVGVSESRPLATQQQLAVQSLSNFQLIMWLSTLASPGWPFVTMSRASRGRRTPKEACPLCGPAKDMESPQAMGLLCTPARERERERERQDVVPGDKYHDARFSAVSNGVVAIRHTTSPSDQDNSASRQPTREEAQEP